MIKRDALGCARLLDSHAEEVFPEGLEINVIRRQADWGVSLTFEGRTLQYFDKEEVERMLNDYLNKLRVENLENQGVWIP